MCNLLTVQKGLNLWVIHKKAQLHGLKLGFCMLIGLSANLTS